MSKAQNHSRRKGGSVAYISIAFTNRNDNYGGDLKARIDKFIDYYAYLVAIDPTLFEFIVCDWNPPADKPLLADAFDWGRLGAVTHVLVPPELHQKLAGESNSPMLDYFGRNVALRHGTAPFALVINQDIFLSRSLFDILRKRQLNPECFYRADRIDFDFTSIADAAPEQIEANALASSFEIHRRHSARYEEISVSYAPETAAQVASSAEDGDTVDIENGIIACTAAEERRQRSNQAKPGEPLFDARKADDYYYGFYLHTNASGDFLLASREAFEKIHGLPERTDFYMHSDSYAVFQFFAAGYRLCIFQHPHKTFHADHDRSSRDGRFEGYEYAQHEAVFSSMVRGDVPFTMNDGNWGLADHDLSPFGSENRESAP